jgi:hypothetical protein
LDQYHEDVIEAVNKAGEKAVKKLVRITKATAPVLTGRFIKSITHKVVEKFTGDKEFIWGVSAPEHRKTHLLVNGHLAADGSRVPGDPFLEKALDTVLPEYESDVEEALTR